MSLVLFAALIQATAVAGQASPPNPAGAAAAAAIPARDLSELDRCRPLRIGEASECMRRALGDKTAAEINTAAGERYRAAFADLIMKKWDLTNPEAPVSRDLRGLRIYDPSDAAYVLLTDMAARIGRYRLDYERFARERAARPGQAVRPAPAAPAPQDPQPGPLPLERCKRQTDDPSLLVITCTLNPDRTISRTMSGVKNASIPTGATPLPLERCQAIGPIPAGSRLKACFKLPDGKLLRQTTRLIEGNN